MYKNRCKKLRGKHTQKDIANLIGITQQAYSKIEKANNLPRMEICVKLSKIFQKPIDYIFPDIFLTINTSKTCINKTNEETK